MPILPPRTVTWRTAARKKHQKNSCFERFLGGAGGRLFFFFLFQGVYLDFQIDSFQLRAECFCMDILLDSKIIPNHEKEKIKVQKS